MTNVAGWAEMDVDPADVLRGMSVEEIRQYLDERVKKAPKSPFDLPPSKTEIAINAIDADAFEEALWHWHAGRRVDALYFLEKALGKTWLGLADLAGMPA